MIINRLEWDSNFFGFRIGRVEIQSEDQGVILANQKSLLKSKYDLIYVFSSHGLGVFDSDAKLVDEKVIYTMSDDFCSEENPNVVLWDADLGVTEDLLHLALVSGAYSRFKLDERFPTGSYERLYSRWIEQSVNHTIATEVFCYVVDNTPRGEVTLNVNEGKGTIGLFAVHEDFQHKGIGSAMMQHVVYYAQRHHCKTISVATQLKNVPACRLYEKSGFVVESVTDVWHWWL